ncbi:DUF6283 family protein [Streptomyces flaveolus]|uniref:DUF6283 family protein n=1 Tax=Streptomyces flaveolus TaxID=67297 RepID=UPI003443C7E0
MAGLREAPAPRPSHPNPAPEAVPLPLHDRNDDRARICGGWAGCHDGDELLALRVASIVGDLTAETAEAVRNYISPVPLFSSGAEAAAHGMRDIPRAGPRRPPRHGQDHPHPH